jgi:hypothetical protein
MEIKVSSHCRALSSFVSYCGLYFAQKAFLLTSGIISIFMKHHNNTQNRHPSATPLGPVCSKMTLRNILYSKCSCSRTPDSETSGVQGEAGIQPEAWGHETACAPSKWSQVHGNISPPANLLLPLPRVYLVSFFLTEYGF